MTYTFNIVKPGQRKLVPVTVDIPDVQPKPATGRYEVRHYGGGDRVRFATDEDAIAYARGVIAAHAAYYTGLGVTVNTDTLMIVTDVLTQRKVASVGYDYLGQLGAWAYDAAGARTEIAV